MSYRFVIGSAGAGKSRALREEIIARAERSMSDPGGDSTRYIYMVPEQYNMQTQMDLVRASSAGGIMNIDVLGFGRLAYRVFSETGTQTGTVIDEMGKLLVLRKLAGDVRGQLRVLQRSIHRPGMASEIKSVISEFMQYGIGPDELEELIRYAGGRGHGALQARLEDILVIYRAFMSFREGRFVTAEETLDLLADRIGQAESLRGAVIVFDGFADFTPVQYRVIRELLRCAGEVIFSITGPAEAGRGSWEAAAAGRTGSEQDLFYVSRKTVRDIAAAARSVGAVHGTDLYLEGGARFRDTPVLGQLEAQIFRRPVTPCTVDPDPILRCLQAGSPEEEVQGICTRIRSLVLEEGYTYRDIAVVTGDLETYGPLFEKTARRSGIPFYLDRTVRILQNPLTDGLKSALSIVSESFSYESVFGYLRSGLSRLAQEETDLLENYCLEHGIAGRRKWAAAFDEQTEPLRQKLLKELEPLTGPLEGLRGERQRRPGAGRKTGQRTEEVYAFLEGIGAGERMEELADAFAEQGDAVQERICRQIYRSLLVLLEQIWGLLGEEDISAAEYQELIESCCSAVRLGTLPQKADRILIGDIRRTRLPEVRILFIAGVNDGIIPPAASNGGLLSDLDREFLKTSDLELAPSPRERIFTQRFHLYQNMTRAAERLVFSWSAAGSDGRSLYPSYLIGLLKEIFPLLEKQPALPAALWDRFSSVRDALPGMSLLLRAYADERADSEALTLYRVLWEKGTTEERDRLHGLGEAAFLRYRPVPIDPGTAAGLYGQTLTGSVTMLEQAAQCMLRQFLQYGLRLKERKQFEFKPVDAGTVLHRGLERFSGKVRSRGLNWSKLTPEELHALAEESLAEEASTYHDLILYATHRSQYRLQVLRQILNKTVEELQFQLRQGSFEPWAYEMVFGGDRNGRDLYFPLSRGRELRLRGKIDRVDLCREPEGTYVKIMDYKSGSRDLDPAEIAAGRQLQLILYMNAVLKILQEEKEGEVSPSAMLYYRMTDPVILEEGDDPESREKKRRKLLRPTGLVRSDGRDVELLDGSGDSDSLVIPVSRKKDGGLKAHSKVYSLEEFRGLTALVNERICAMAEEILDGSVEALPYKDKKTTACTWCPYREVCGFDLKTPGYHYRT